MMLLTTSNITLNDCINEDTLFNYGNTFPVGSEEFPLTYLAAPFIPTLDIYMGINETQNMKLISMNEAFNKSLDDDFNRCFNDTFNTVDFFSNEFNQKSTDNDISSGSEGSFSLPNDFDNTKVFKWNKDTNKSELSFTSQPSNVKPFNEPSNQIAPQIDNRPSLNLEVPNFLPENTNQLTTSNDIFPQILTTTPEIPKYLLETYSNNSDYTTEWRNPIIHSDPIVPIIDSRFPMQTTFNTNNEMPIRTSFTHSANSEIYQNPVQDGLLEPMKQVVYETPPAKFKDNINLKMKLGKDYESIISRLNQPIDRTNYIVPNYTPKRKHKLFQQRRTGKPPVSDDIAKSFELATKAILKGNSPSRSTTLTPDSIDETTISLSPLGSVVVPKLESQTIESGLNKAFPFPNKFEELKTRFAKAHIESIPIEKIDSYCIECKLEITNYWEFAEHSQLHKCKQERTFYCPVKECPMNVLGFSQRASLVHHCYGCHFHRGEILQRFGIWEVELRKILFNCEVAGCEKAFSRRDSLSRHNRVIHGIENDGCTARRNVKRNFRTRSVDFDSNEPTKKFKTAIPISS